MWEMGNGNLIASKIYNEGQLIVLRTILVL